MVMTILNASNGSPSLYPGPIPTKLARTAPSRRKTQHAGLEIVVRKPWRGRGVAWQIHEEWLARRAEQRVTLLVNPVAGNGSVQAVYEAWGFRAVGQQQPFPDSPVYASMTRELA